MATFFHQIVVLVIMVHTFLKFSCGTNPKSCIKVSETYVNCRPWIPSFLDFDELDLLGIKAIRLDRFGSLMWSLQTLPNDIFETARDLNNLRMDNVGLEKLPCDVFHPFQQSLQRVYLNNNLFKVFPICSLKNFPALEHVELQNQRLESFQSNMINWKSVHSISLRNNELSVLIVSDINNQNEVRIYLDDNKISVLQIFDANFIKYLSAKNNRIENLNQNIFQTSLTTLIYLDLSHNMLNNSIWNVLARVSTLQTLKLNNNQISFANSFILNSAGNLEYLDLSNNQLKSLAGVALMSGKFTHLLLNSNELTEIPSDLTSGTRTFGISPQQYELSDNSIGKIHISIPSAASLSVRLDKNKLKTVTFEYNRITISTLNISHNELSRLPQFLPKANTYVLSYNPLNTTDVISKLTSEMLEASVIELENVGLFCGDKYPSLPTISHSNLRSLNLKHNCVPFNIICHIYTSCTAVLSLYLDNNTAATQLSCSLRDKCFNMLSLNKCNLNAIENIIGYANTKYFKKISVRNNNVQNLALIQNNFVENLDISYDFSMNKIKVFEGFDISGGNISLKFEGNHISSIRTGKVRFRPYKYGDSYFTLTFSNNSVVNINDSLVHIYFFEDYFLLQPYIYIDLSNNYIEKLMLKNSIVVHQNKDRVHRYIDLIINISHNKIQSLEDCPILDKGMNVDFALDLSYNNITTFPNISCMITYYWYYMYLGHNKIREIIAPIPPVTMQVLDLQWNIITEIHPYAFVNMSRLLQLNLRGNRIHSFPSSINTQKELYFLDISFNRLKHISKSDFSNLKKLQTLMINNNNFFVPANDLQFNKHNHLEENELHCDCNMMFLRNQSFGRFFKVYGRCTSPPEYEGYHVSCFPISQCIGVDSIYINGLTLEICQADTFTNITMTVTETINTLIITVKVVGERIPKQMNMKAYKNSELIKQVDSNNTGRSNFFWLDSNFGTNRLCFLSFFDDNITFSRCFALNLKSGCSNTKTEGDNGTLNGISSLLAISLFVIILTGVVTIIACRKYLKKADKRHSNRPERYEVTTVIGSVNGGNFSQPAYEEISGVQSNDSEHAYTNLSMNL